MVRTLPTVSVITGPTATGKTDLAIALGDHHQIVSADASMVYRGLDIGTAKPLNPALPHHLIDILEPDQAFSVSEYVDLAESAIQDVLQQGKTPLVVGGTGYYIRALSEGLFDLPEPDLALQASLWEIVQSSGLKGLQQELGQVSPEDALRVGQNPRRVVRAVEILRRTGLAPAQLPKRAPLFEYRKLVLWPSWDWLEPRLITRTEQMFALGLVEEVAGLLKRYPSMPTALQSIGYKEVSSYLRAECTLAEAKNAVTQATRAYAKRQHTWFRKEPGAVYLDIAKPQAFEEALAWWEKR
jgi:tRNA dimethylallyltransferase